MEPISMALIALAAAKAVQGIGQFNQSKSQARALAKQGARAAEQRADEIIQLASRQRVNYIQNGLELEGTPQAVVNDTYIQGLEDIQAIKSDYNQAIKNQKRSARWNLLGSLVNAGATAASGFSGTGNALEAGAYASGGTYAGMSQSGYQIFNIPGTAATAGGNVAINNGSFYDVTGQSGGANVSIFNGMFNG